MQLLTVLHFLFPKENEKTILNNKHVKGILATLLSILLLFLFVLILISLFSFGCGLFFGIMLFPASVVALFFFLIYRRIKEKGRSPILLMIAVLWGAFVFSFLLFFALGFLSQAKEPHPISETIKEARLTHQSE